MHARHILYLSVLQEESRQAQTLLDAQQERQNCHSKSWFLFRVKRIGIRVCLLTITPPLRTLLSSYTVWTEKCDLPDKEKTAAVI